MKDDGINYEAGTCVHSEKGKYIIVSDEGCDYKEIDFNEAGTDAQWRPCRLSLTERFICPWGDEKLLYEVIVIKQTKEALLAVGYDGKPISKTERLVVFVGYDEVIKYDEEHETNRWCPMTSTVNGADIKSFAEVDFSKLVLQTVSGAQSAFC